MLTIEKPIYVYILPTRVNQGLSTEPSTGLNFFIRFAWILNLVGCSGLVLLFLTVMHYPTISLKISKEYGSRRTTDDDSNEEGNGTDVSVESGISNTTATNLSGRRRTGNAASTLLGHHRRATGGPLLDPSTENNLPMPPPYTSREPSISRHPMSPPPRYTSTLGIDNVVEEPRELHVNIPEEQETTATIASNGEQQPPNYIEEQE